MPLEHFKIHPLQSSEVVDANADRTIVSISRSSAVVDDSMFIINVFTFEKASSIGLKSGE